MRPSRPAFTLVELVAVIAIVGGVAAVLSPIVAVTADAYARSSAHRDASERVAAAMDRVVRALRETPPVEPGEPGVDITFASATRVDLGDGVRIRLLGSTLWFTPADDDPSPLCQNVTTFALTYLGHDGSTSTLAQPQQTQRVHVRLAADGYELRTAVFLRAAELQP